ncbi:hypothetical protein ACHAXT_005437 [Thalassiosira profunda]
MALHGVDINGNPFPPRLPPELCEDIPVGGGGTDANKKCFTESNIRPVPVVALDAEVPIPKVLCLIYTMAEAHSTRIRAIRDTWAGGCDGFLAFSTVSDPRLPAISLEHEGEESYDNMWQKVRSIWTFVGYHYFEDFDWFYLGGDDLFVIPDNLRAYLASLAFSEGGDPRKTAYYVGRRYSHRKTGRYNSYSSMTSSF